MRREDIKVGEVYLIRVSVTAKEADGNMLSAVTSCEGEPLQVHPDEIVTSLARYQEERRILCGRENEKER